MPSDDDLTIQELASILEQDSKEAPPLDVDNEFDIHEDKRSWDKFVDGWGKRNKWEKFRGKKIEWELKPNLKLKFLSVRKFSTILSMNH